MAYSFDALAVMFELLPDAILIVNEERIIVECNNKVFDVFGYKPRELKGNTLDVLIPENLRATHTDQMKIYELNKRTRKMGDGRRLVGRKKDNAEIEVDIALAPLPTPEKTYTLAVVRDISDRLKLERKICKLERTREELEKFAMTVSHDLKAPLQRVKMLVYLILSQVPAGQNEEVRQMTEHLNTTLADMERLIHGVLDYARAANDEDTDNLDLNQIFNDVKKNIVIPENFHIEVTRSLPRIRGNYTKVFQVFLNLITNAIKYNDKPEGLLKIEWEKQCQEYRFCFADNGVIVPTDQREDIFKLFKTAGRRKNDKESHGVGLSIVKKIIEQMGGNIICRESALGGSCFTFSWPMK